MRTSRRVSLPVPWPGQRAQELETLARISSALRKANDLEELLNILVAETASVLEASAGSIFLLEEDELVLSAVHGLPTGLSGPVDDPLVLRPGWRDPHCNDLLWRVVQSGSLLHHRPVSKRPSGEFLYRKGSPPGGPSW